MNSLKLQKTKRMKQKKDREKEKEKLKKKIRFRNLLEVSQNRKKPAGNFEKVPKTGTLKPLKRAGPNPNDPSIACAKRRHLAAASDE